MPKQTLVDKLNHISSLFRLGPTSANDHAARWFGFDTEFPIVVIGDNRNRFRASMDDLINSFRGIKGTISQSSVIDKLVPLITDKKINEALFTPNDAAEFERWLSGLPIQKYRVIRPILGLEAEAHSTPIQLGDFQIDFGQRLRILAEKSQFLDSILKPEDYNKLFIECTVSARDTDIALECADAFFYRFELIFRFLIGRRTDWVQVGIFSYRGAHMRNRFIISEDGRPLGGGSSWEGALQPFIFGHHGFLCRRARSRSFLSSSLNQTTNSRST